MNVKVSIIIPVYNVSSFLDKCISSCISQSFKDIEIIVVNDGSTDDSIQIIRKYAAEDKRIVVVDEENQGVMFARKLGLDIARGEYVFYLDGDDFIEENTIEILFQKTIDQGADYVIGRFYEVLNGVKKRTFNTGFDELSGPNLLTYILGHGWNLCGRLIKKSLFDGIIYKPIYMGDDLFVNMQVTPKVKKAAWVDAYVYDYVRHAASVTNRGGDNSLKLNMEMLEGIFFLLTVYTYDQKIIEWVYVRFFPFLFSCMEKRKTEINSILRSYYWDKKEVKVFLWKKKKLLYWIVGGYLSYPTVTGLVVKVGKRLLIHYAVR